MECTIALKTDGTRQLSYGVYPHNKVDTTYYTVKNLSEKEL